MTPKLFSELGLSPETLKAIDKLGFEQASPIQAESIPVLMQGRDVVGQSQTGSGKTAAFAVPAIEKVDVNQRAVQVLIPRSALLAIGSDPALSIVAMIVLAMVVSICSNVDSFFALSFASTFTPGSIVAFLLVGPLVDVKMLALLRTTFTTRVLVGLTTSRARIRPTPSSEGAARTGAQDWPLLLL